MPNCDNCGRPHKRKRFCSNKCKDRYHNKHNPRGQALQRNEDGDVVEHDEHEAAMDGATTGWDEGGWLGDD